MRTGSMTETKTACSSTVQIASSASSVGAVRPARNFLSHLPSTHPKVYAMRRLRTRAVTVKKKEQVIVFVDSLYNLVAGGVKLKDEDVGEIFAQLTREICDETGCAVCTIPTARSGIKPALDATSLSSGDISVRWPIRHREWFRAERGRGLRSDSFGGLRCQRSRLFSFVMETTVARGSIRVGGFKKRFEPEESNTRK
jgi:hypothetical protein